MGRKGGWFAAIKRVFLGSSKEKPANERGENGLKEKKKGKLKHGERKSFKIPLFKEPSSIEEILGDAEKEHNIVFRPPTPPEQPRTPSFMPSRVASASNLSERVVSPRIGSPKVALPRAASPKVASPRAASTRRITSPRAASPIVVSPKVASTGASSSKSFNNQKEIVNWPEPSIINQHASATKIQAAFRGYMARRSFRALRGLVRLQGVIGGQSVKRQTINALKYMQLFVRVQSQIQSRRIQMSDDQARTQAQCRNDKEVESTLGKWSLTSEAGNQEYWDDSTITKEERDTRLQKKVEAVIKRERTMAYAYSHKLWRAPPKSVQRASTDILSGGVPWWWNWIDKQVPLSNHTENQSMKSFQLTPPRPTSQPKLSPRILSSNHKQQPFRVDGSETATPRSSRSTVVTISSMQARTPQSRRPRSSSPRSISRYAHLRSSKPMSPFDVPLKDDESLTSCPPFSVPRYMAPTVSAIAKARSSSNPKERYPGTPRSESDRRLSFPLTRGVGPFNRSKGVGSREVSDNHHDRHSIGNMSVDSPVSLLAGVGRKPFNRFV